MGVLNGKYTTYYDNGDIKESGNYIDGYLEGIVTIYNNKGEMIRKINYIKGQKRENLKVIIQ